MAQGHSSLRERDSQSRPQTAARAQVEAALATALSELEEDASALLAQLADRGSGVTPELHIAVSTLMAHAMSANDLLHELDEST